LVAAAAAAAATAVEKDAPDKRGSAGVEDEPHSRASVSSWRAKRVTTSCARWRTTSASSNCARSAVCEAVEVEEEAGAVAWEWELDASIVARSDWSSRMSPSTTVRVAGVSPPATSKWSAVRPLRSGAACGRSSSEDEVAFKEEEPSGITVHAM
jgi:hypothetical protein